MNKFLLSFLVVAGFILQSIYSRVAGASTQNLSAKNAPTETLAPTATVTPSSTLILRTPAIKEKVLSTNTPFPTATPVPTIVTNSDWRDGTYTGTAADAFYGPLQVQATIQNGKLTNIQFLQYPNDRGRSIEINEQADPILAQEAIQAQNSDVNIVSGATDSSQAFIQSLQSALEKAKT